MKKTVEEIKAMKGSEKISVLTCYDYSFAHALDGKVDIILIGDSLGNVVLGYDRTTKVTLSDMKRHLQAVRRGAPNTLIICDLPFGTYDTQEDALANAKELIACGADGVKPEGSEGIVQALTKNNIAVMGHVGLLPQSADKMKLMGKEEEEARAILNQAQAIDRAGAFSTVIESVPNNLAQRITENISIPTIGIGAGSNCDGQVLVLYDLLGLYPNTPGFVKQYLKLQEEISKAAFAYSMDVKKGSFPEEKS